jgi:hypothetical protein
MPPQVRNNNDGTAELAGWVRTPPTTGNHNSLVWATLPVEFRPPAECAIIITGAAQGAAPPKLAIWANGNLIFNFLPTSLVQTNLSIFGRYPLASSGIIVAA